MDIVPHQSPPQSRMSAAKYDMQVNKPYQIDFQNTASDLLGIECRGKEHDVVVVWSSTSGKHLVLFDNEEVYFSKGNRMEPMFAKTWNIPGGHMMKLISHAPPLFPTPGFCQFDLLLDGFSFFNMPHIYELGQSGNRASSLPLVPAPVSSLLSEDDAVSNYYSASSSSLPEEIPATMPAPSALPAASTDLLEGPPTDDYPMQNDEFAPVAPPPIDEQTAFALASNQIMSAYASPPSSAPAITNEAASASSSTALVVAPTTPKKPYYPQAPPAAAYSVPPVTEPTAIYHQASPVPTMPYEQSPPPQYQQQQQQHTPVTPFDHQAYQHQPADAATFYAAAPATSPSSPQQQQNIYSSPSPPVVMQPAAAAVVMPEPTMIASSLSALTTTTTTGGVRLTMEPLNELDLMQAEEEQQPQLSMLDRAMKNLVNFEDISEIKDSPQQIKAQQVKQQNLTSPKSKPLPPTKADWSVGDNACLSDIHKHAPQKAAPRMEIMRTHAFDPAAVQAGMMVVYGSTPSLGAGGGFGAGAGMMMMQHQAQPSYYHPPAQQHHQPMMYQQ